jgi:peptide/nickel transport system substrate-binding protein
MMSDPSRHLSHPVSRRDILRYGAGAAALAAAGATGLAACGSSASTGATSPQSSSGSPKRGGTLTAGLSGGSSSDTVDGEKTINSVDEARVEALYDALIALDLNAKPVFRLAESITSNSDATVWTARLRPGIEFHNGKPLTADDLIYSYRRIVDQNLPAAGLLSLCDVANMKALDSLTVKIPCKAPYGTFLDALASDYNAALILPTDFDPNHPAGTGPFKFKSFTPGETSTFIRNDNYWDGGSGPVKRPYIDTLIINDFADETSQVNALISKAVDCIDQLSIASIDTVRSAGQQVLISKGGGIAPVTMRIDVAPFNDVNVRQAIRLCVDRVEMRELVFGGYGVLGNDITSIWDPEYDTAIPQRQQDIAQAKYLLKKADREDLTVTLVAAPIAQGTMSMAQVLQQQARQAGITINIQQVTSNVLFGPSYLKWPFSMDYYSFNYYYPQVGLSFLPTASFNETHFAEPAKAPLPPGVGERYIKLYDQAQSTANESTRAEIAHEMQMIDYSYGGYLIPYFTPVLDAYTPRLHGVTPGLAGQDLGNYSFENFWFE